MTGQPFVPSDFAVPTELVTPAFRLEPLGPEHNAADYAAWTGRAELDVALYEAVSTWLTELWPFGTIDYASR
jgi:hypothetical protein